MISLYEFEGTLTMPSFDKLNVETKLKQILEMSYIMYSIYSTRHNKYNRCIREGAINIYSINSTIV